jgi:hypothetical protein
MDLKLGHHRNFGSGSFESEGGHFDGLPTRRLSGTSPNQTSWAFARAKKIIARYSF